MADKLTIIEDEGAEQLAREGEFELAIPFSLYVYNDGGIRINVFPSLKKDAEEFLSLFPDDRMFSLKRSDGRVSASAGRYRRRVTRPRTRMFFSTIIS